MKTTFSDPAECPTGHVFTVRRHLSSAGWVTKTKCPECGMKFDMRAGHPGTHHQLRERDIEARLVKRVKELGGEVRKVQWIGRNSAPDRVVMLPGTVFSRNGIDTPVGIPRTIWVELKAPGKAATFPRTAIEHAQYREHERMRKVGQRVEVVDSYERIEEILK